MQAGQKVSFDGTQYYTVNSDSIQLEDGHSYILVKAWAIHAARDVTAPVHLTRLECVGAFDVRRDNSFEASGYCNHWDRDGHKWVGHWWNNSKMDAARYEVFTGDGKYAGATGGGTSKCNWLKTGAVGSLVCELTGTIELK